jgi:signal transduction histidine kinase
MPESHPHYLHRLLKHVVHRLLRLSTFRVVVVFIVAAVLISMAIVLAIDLLWDGRLNAELEFAGVVTPFLDALLIVGLLAVLLDELRHEAGWRRQAEQDVRRMNEELERMVRERTRQLMEAQEELVHREKLAVLGQVADTVGHELRNPLGVMNNAVYYLQAVLLEADESTKEYLGIIKDEIAEAERIVSDLLDAVRTKPPHPAVVELADAIGQSLRKCDVPASVKVSLDIPAALPPVRVDPGHLHQVLWNLVANAVEAMPQGGELSIRASHHPADGHVAVSVQDTGSGIARELQDKLFQPLFTTKARRVGLGLVVVKNLAQSNGGSVSVQSEPGKGSTFTVTLPVAD